MTVQAWIILDTTEAADAVALNTEEIAVAPRDIENSLANNLGLGVLVGKNVLPARLLNDPDYTDWVPTLGALPITVMDSDTLFLPVTEV